MASEIHLYYASGSTCYFLVRTKAGLIWNTDAGAFELWNASNYTDYDIPMVDAGGGFYTGSFPAADPGTYYVTYLLQAGVDPATTDIQLDGTSFEWGGAAAVSAGVSSYYAESFLTRGISDFREHTDEPEVNPKYSDARVIRKLEEAYSTVLGDIQRVSVTPVVAKYNVAYVTGVESYTLPPTVGTIMAVYYSSEEGYRVFYSAYGRLNPSGRGVWLEGKTLHIQANYLGDGKVLTVEYTPLAPRLFNGTYLVAADGKTVTMGGAYQGTKDTRANAYAGCVFRVLGDSDSSYNYVQERTILSHAPTTGVLVLDTALSPNCYGSTGTSYFEIAPAIPLLMDQVVPLFAAYQVALREGAIQRSGLLRKAYWDALRNAQLSAFYSDIQNNLTARADNFNNRRYRARGF